MEREKRSYSGSIRVDILRRDQKVPKQFTKSLGNSANKTSLIKFLFADWSAYNEHDRQVGDKEIFMTEEDEAYCISNSRGEMRAVPVPELCSKQEEADTKLFLCASFASGYGFNSVKIITVDTDVLVLAIYYQQLFDCLIYVEYGTGAHVKIYNIKGNTLSESLSNVLPSFHALTGCDSTSSFSGIEKAKAFKVLQSNERFVDALAVIGEELVLPDFAEEPIQKHICSLYGEKEVTNVNDARFKLFTSVKKLADPQRLPPTADALALHLKRVNYQVFEWKRALDVQFENPEPNDHGWYVKDWKLAIQWVTQLPALEVILEFISCGCKKSRCLTNACRCKIVNLRCTSICNCNNCDNNDGESESEGQESSDDSSELSDSEHDEDEEK